ncbi:hypothetical protein QCA50_001756 [Cerrena zonata]|uniref:Uncharacterized protein n=1 Tax=Cerrena zonata TaxID=2478898 RepID=A0AAW0GXP2_9APHY
MSKPTLYTFDHSVWAAVPEIALVELEYPSDAVEKKVGQPRCRRELYPRLPQTRKQSSLSYIYLRTSDSFSCSQNPHATLPTLTAGGKDLRQY